MSDNEGGAGEAGPEEAALEKRGKRTGVLSGKKRATTLRIKSRVEAQATCVTFQNFSQASPQEDSTGDLQY
jgi:hypothetical protein